MRLAHERPPVDGWNYTAQRTRYRVTLSREVRDVAPDGCSVGSVDVVHGTLILDKPVRVHAVGCGSPATPHEYDDFIDVGDAYTFIGSWRVIEAEEAGE